MEDLCYLINSKIFLWQFSFMVIIVMRDIREFFLKIKKIEGRMEQIDQESLSRNMTRNLSWSGMDDDITLR